MLTLYKHYLKSCALLKIIIPTLQMRKMRLQMVTLLITEPIEDSAGTKSSLANTDQVSLLLNVLVIFRKTQPYFRYTKRALDLPPNSPPFILVTD